MPRAKILTELERGKIIAFNDLGFSQREIAKRIGRSQKVICYFLKNPEGYGTIKRCGRHPKLSKRLKRRILKEVSNTTKGCRRIRAEIAPQVSYSTVYRAINDHLC
uniref:Tc3 transposase DNA binding domain-containing protein n=1 Tax=Meloidogyne javanica TaxID=6303 RepID=A0A915LUB1_MELJA